MRQVLLRLDDKLFNQLQETAKKDARSVNSLLTILVKRLIAQENKSLA